MLVNKPKLLLNFRIEVAQESFDTEYFLFVATAFQSYVVTMFERVEAAHIIL